MTKHALHNALFAAIIYNNHKLVIELLNYLLPCEQLVKLDFGTIKFESTVFTDGEGNERRADAVVTVMSKDRSAVTYQLRGDPRGAPLGNKQVGRHGVIELSD